MLSVFGGAGAQHACAVAKNLGIKSIFIHKHAGILSAVGLSRADIVEDHSEPCNLNLENESSMILAQEHFDRIKDKNTQKLQELGFLPEHIAHHQYLNLRYEGTDTALMIRSASNEEFKKEFLENYKREFGFFFDDRKIFIDDIRVRSEGSYLTNEQKQQMNFDEKLLKSPTKSPLSSEKIYFEEKGEVQESECPVYQMSELEAFDRVIGPALILNQTCTIVVEPGWSLRLTQQKDIVIEEKVCAESVKKGIIPETADSIELSIFANRSIFY